jgi:itaconate CoA-transferase
LARIMLPLSGITVVSVEQAIAAPLATRHLADLGARVIKVERPGSGDFARRYDSAVNGFASYFVWVNRSKESVTLNLKDVRAKGLLSELIQRADVFVENLGPGVAARLGFEAAELRSRSSALVTCAISGYGNGGPLSSKKAYDLLIQCETGLLSVTGTPEAPSKVGISIADIAGGMYALTGILTALYRRQITGVGATLEVALFDALAEWMGHPLYYTMYGGTAPARSGASHSTIVPYGPFATADGEVFLAVQNETEWRSLCVDVLGNPSMAVDVRFSSNVVRLQNRVELEEAVGKVLRTLPTATVLGRLTDANIATARLNSVQELVGHPQLSDRRRWRGVSSPVGTVEMLLPPVQMDECDPVMAAIPDLGEHTDRVLGELGVSKRELEALRREGAI